MNGIVHGNRNDAGKLVAYLTRDSRDIGSEVVLTDSETGQVIRTETVVSIQCEAASFGEDGSSVVREVQVLRDVDSGIEREVVYTSRYVGLSSPEMAALELEALGSKLKADAYLSHMTYSWPAADVVTIEEAFAAAERGVRALGYTGPAVYSIHEDTDNFHVHVAVFRGVEREPGKWIANDPWELHPRGDWFALNGPDQFCRTMEAEHNRLVPDRQWTIDRGMDRDAAIRRMSEQMRFRDWLRVGDERGSVQADLQAFLATEGRNWAGLHTLLDRYGVGASRRGAGLLYSDVQADSLASKRDGHVKASILPREFRFAELEAALGPFAPAPWVASVKTIEEPDFAKYVLGDNHRARRIRDDLGAALRHPTTLSRGQALQDAARAHGLAVVKAKSGGYRVVDLHAPDDPRRGVKVTDLGAAFRKLGAQLGGQIPDPQPVRDAAERAPAESGYIRYLQEDAAVRRLAKGEELAADPRLALNELMSTRAAFSSEDLRSMLLARVATAEQADRVFDWFEDRVRVGELVALRVPKMNQKTGEIIETTRYTTAERLAFEPKFAKAVKELAQVARARAIGYDPKGLDGLRPGQRASVAAFLDGEAIAILNGHAGSGKSYAAGRLREIVEAQGLNVIGVAPVGKAADGLRLGAQIERTFTIDALLARHERGQIEIDSRTVLVVDEMNMADDRKAYALLELRKKTGARMFIAGDDAQLKPVGPGDPWQIIRDEFGGRVIELGAADVLRQSGERLAAIELARSPETVGKSIEAHMKLGLMGMHENLDGAKSELLRRYADALERGIPLEGAYLFAYANDDVDELAAEARAYLDSQGLLSDERRSFASARGPLEIAIGERLYFTKNEYQHINVRNGTIGTVTGFGENGTLRVRLDGDEAREIVVDAATYPHVGYAYAITVTRSEGLTCKWSGELITRADNRNSFYVAASRSTTDEFYAAFDQETFHFNVGNKKQDYVKNVTLLLSRETEKELASSYERAEELRPLRTVDDVRKDRHANFGVAAHRLQALQLGADDPLGRVAIELAEVRAAAESRDKKLREEVPAFLKSPAGRSAYPTPELSDAEKQRRFHAIKAKTKQEMREATLTAKVATVELGVLAAADRAARRGVGEDRAWQGASWQYEAARAVVRDASGAVLFDVDGRGTLRAATAAGIDAGLDYLAVTAGGAKFDIDKVERAFLLRRAEQLGVPVLDATAVEQRAMMQRELGKKLVNFGDVAEERIEGRLRGKRIWGEMAAITLVEKDGTHIYVDGLDADAVRRLAYNQTYSASRNAENANAIALVDRKTVDRPIELKQVVGMDAAAVANRRATERVDMVEDRLDPNQTAAEQYRRDQAAAAEARARQQDIDRAERTARNRAADKAAAKSQAVAEGMLAVPPLLVRFVKAGVDAMYGRLREVNAPLADQLDVISGGLKQFYAFVQRDHVKRDPATIIAGFDSVYSEAGAIKLAQNQRADLRASNTLSVADARAMDMDEAARRPRDQRVVAAVEDVISMPNLKQGIDFKRDGKIVATADVNGRIDVLTSDERDRDLVVLLRGAQGVGVAGGRGLGESQDDAFRRAAELGVPLYAAKQREIDRWEEVAGTAMRPVTFVRADITVAEEEIAALRASGLGGEELTAREAVIRRAAAHEFSSGRSEKPRVSDFELDGWDVANEHEERAIADPVPEPVAFRSLAEKDVNKKSDDEPERSIEQHDSPPFRSLASRMQSVVVPGTPTIRELNLAERMAAGLTKDQRVAEAVIAQRAFVRLRAPLGVTRSEAQETAQNLAAENGREWGGTPRETISGILRSATPLHDDKSYVVVTSGTRDYAAIMPREQLWMHDHVVQPGEPLAITSRGVDREATAELKTAIREVAKVEIDAVKAKRLAKSVDPAAGVPRAAALETAEKASKLARLEWHGPGSERPEPKWVGEIERIDLIVDEGALLSVRNGRRMDTIEVSRDELVRDDASALQERDPIAIANEQIDAERTRELELERERKLEIERGIEYGL